jgi:hypothetical protein
LASRPVAALRFSELVRSSFSTSASVKFGPNHGQSSTPLARILGLAIALASAACTSGGSPVASTLDASSVGARHVADAADTAPPTQRYAIHVASVDTTFRTEDHFIAGVEMQLSGEPFAESMGRDLRRYKRNDACEESVCPPGIYYGVLPTVASGDGGRSRAVDIAGFSSAVESYEYSKQPMNNLAFESGAGTSLLFGPVLNPNAVTGRRALELAQTWFSHMATASNAEGRFVLTTDASHPLGWPGLWPTLQPFAEWDPAIRPTKSAGCSISSDDNPGAKGALASGDYECDYTSLHLPNRDRQVVPTIGPGASGWADWKYALWTLNYLQSMHASKETTVTSVNPTQLSYVGVPGNAVAGGRLPGVYLGSSNIEGFQAGNFIQILDNQAAQWLLQLATANGVTLGGFASVSDALRYGPANQLRWFPSSIHVTEKPDASGFPAPTGYRIADPASRLLDLAGLIGAYATVYTLTDQANEEVGGSQPARAYFDGDPFPEQNQIPEGAPTLHDRALAMVRVLVVNIDRMHRDPATGSLVDYAAASRGSLSRGAVLSSDAAAYTLLALRTARRALDSQLALYSNTTPDTAGIPSPLDAFPPLDGMTTFAARLDTLIANLAEAFYDRLTTPEGRAYVGWDVSRAAPTDSGSSLDAHTAAVRGLLIGYLATGAMKYRARARSVFDRIERAFYDRDARVYRAVEGDASLQVTFTPRRFALLQAMLRDSYELVAVLPGNDAMAALIGERVGRLNKLVLNGWDDRDGDERIEWPSECARLGADPKGRPLGLGGLQMAERALTGESGSTDDPLHPGLRVLAEDHDHDCVPEISAAGLPAALASSVTFTLTPWTVALEGQVFRGGRWSLP